MQKVLVRLTSVTYAIRAQKLLERHGIRSLVKKVSHSLQVSGCGYSLEINAINLDAAQAILNSEGIRIVEISMG